MQTDVSVQQTDLESDQFLFLRFDILKEKYCYFGMLEKKSTKGTGRTKIRKQTQRRNNANISKIGII